MRIFNKIIFIFILILIRNAHFRVKRIAAHSCDAEWTRKGGQTKYGKKNSIKHHRASFIQCFSCCLLLEAAARVQATFLLQFEQELVDAIL